MAPITSVSPTNDDADLGDCAGETVPAERVLLREEVHARGDRGDDERQVGDPDRRHMDVQQPHGLALVDVGRREAEPEQRRASPSRRSWRFRVARVAVSRGPRRVAESAVVGRLGSVVVMSIPAFAAGVIGSFVDQRAEGEGTADTERNGEDRQQADPRPAVRQLRHRRCRARIRPLVVAPIRTGATAGSVSSGSSVSRPVNPAAKASVQRTDRGEPARRGDHGCDEEHSTVRRIVSPYRQTAANNSTTSSTSSCSAEPDRLAEKDRPGVDAGHAQRVERTIIGLDRERALHEQRAG